MTEKISAKREIVPLNADQVAKIQEICVEISGGSTLSAICRRPEMPAPSTVRMWLLEHPDAAALYKIARREQAWSLFDETLDHANALLLDPDRDMARATDIAIRAKQWSAERLDPDAFGRKTATQALIGVVINTSLDLGGGPGAVAGQKGYTLTALVTDVDATPDEAALAQAEKRRRKDKAKTAKVKAARTPRPAGTPRKLTARQQARSEREALARQRQADWAMKQDKEYGRQPV